MSRLEQSSGDLYAKLSLEIFESRISSLSKPIVLTPSILVGEHSSDLFLRERNKPSTLIKQKISTILKSKNNPTL